MAHCRRHSRLLCANRCVARRLLLLDVCFPHGYQGLLSPVWVCEACLQCAGRQAQPDSNLALMFIAFLELLQALVKATLAVSKVLCEFCSAVLIHPRLSTAVLITAGFLATLL